MQKKREGKLSALEDCISAKYLKSKLTVTLFDESVICVNYWYLKWPEMYKYLPERYHYLLTSLAE
jgi:hypothetical protein